MIPINRLKFGLLFIVTLIIAGGIPFFINRFSRQNPLDSTITSAPEISSILTTEDPELGTIRFEDPGVYRLELARQLDQEGLVLNLPDEEKPIELRLDEKVGKLERVQSAQAEDDLSHKVCYESPELIKPLALEVQAKPKEIECEIILNQYPEVQEGQEDYRIDWTLENTENFKSRSWKKFKPDLSSPIMERTFMMVKNGFFQFEPPALRTAPVKPSKGIWKYNRREIRSHFPCSFLRNGFPE